MHRLQNYTQEDYSNNQLSGQKRKRNRQPLSCRACRSRKVACDREQPCSNCVKQSKQQDCIYGNGNDSDPESRQWSWVAPPQNQHGSSSDGLANVREPSTSELRMERRMERLEQLVQSLANKIDARENESRPISNMVSTQSMPIEPSLANPLVESIQEAEQANIHSKAVFCMKAPGTIYYIGKSGYTTVHHHNTGFLYSWRGSFKSQWEAVGQLQLRFPGWHRRAILDCGLAAPLPEDWETVMLQMIPEKKICEVLVQRFLQTFNATHPVIDTESFQAEMTTFFEQKQAKSTMWLALFVAVLALGWQLPIIPFPPEVYTTRGKAHGLRLMSLIQSVAFQSSTWLRRPSLLRFQLIIMLIFGNMLTLDWVDGSDVVSGLLGLATRMAYTMGLHRDPRFARRYSASETELCRKLWLTLNFIDFEHSLQCGMPFTAREVDSDVLPPELLGPFWPEYQQYLHKILPLWASITRLTTSSKSGLTKDELAKLQQKLDTSLAQNNAPWPLQHTSPDPEDSRTGITAQLQCALLRNIGHRLNLVLNTPLLDSPDPAVQLNSAKAVLTSSQAFLTAQSSLTTSIQELPLPARDAWTHIQQTLSQCNIYNMSNSLLCVIRQSFTSTLLSTSLGPTFSAPSLLTSLKTSIAHQEKTLALSPSVIKQHMVLRAQIWSAAEHLRLMRRRRLEVMELSISDEELIVQVMQQAMDESIEKANTAVDEALKGCDPPSLLCEGVSGEVFQRLREDVGCNAQVGMGAEDATAMGALEMGFKVSDWALDQDLLADISMDLPWWSTGPLPL